MSIGSNWLEWVRNKWGRGLLAQLGFVTTVIGFVKLIRGDYYLGFTILGILILAGLLLAFIYVSFYTISSPVVPSRKIYILPVEDNYQYQVEKNSYNSGEQPTPLGFFAVSQGGGTTYTWAVP
jgi:hypothetical protein